MIGSIFQPTNIRVVRPERIAIRLVIEQTRKIKAQGFERSVRADKTRILRIFLIQPKSSINFPKFSFRTFEIAF